ncbi:hypothetical protein ACHAWF_010848, partial [Thalassiosira exigua]
MGKCKLMPAMTIVLRGVFFYYVLVLWRMHSSMTIDVVNPRLDPVIATERTSRWNNVKKHTDFVVTKHDVSNPGWNWDRSPVVIESHKLIFFTIPKVGCTVFKQLFRRMMGHENWKTKDPHDPRRNGLDYLSEWSFEEAAEIMASLEWTRAVFIRDPKQRFLSAYLDKAVRKEGQYVNRHCCNKDWTCAPKN